MKRKILLITIAAILTVLALGTSTYAWFVLANAASVEQVEFEVTAGIDVELSVDTGAVKTWKTSLSSSDIDPLTTGVVLEDLTSTDGRVIKYLDGTVIPTTENSFVEFKIYFRVGNLEAPRSGSFGMFLTDYNNASTYLSMGRGTAITSKGISWKPLVDFNYDYDSLTDQPIVKTTADAYDNFYVSECARLSFTYLNGLADQSVIFDLSSNPARGYAFNPNPTDLVTKYGALDYFNRFANENVSLPATTQTVVTKTQLSDVDNYRTLLVNNNNSLICNLELNADGYYYGETILRLWLEGWDADCYNAVLKDKIKASFNFELGKLA